MIDDDEPKAVEHDGPEHDGPKARPRGRTKHAEPKPGRDHLIEVRKGGETIRVHPTCVEDHRTLGWLPV